MKRALIITAWALALGFVGMIAYAGTDERGCWSPGSGACLSLRIHNRITAPTCASPKDDNLFYYESDQAKFCICDAGVYKCSAAVASTTTTTTTTSTTTTT